MTIVDANVLLYAVNASEPRNDEARQWLDTSLSGREAVGFAWTVLLAFVRLTTKVGLFPHPLTVTEALDRVERWRAQPAAVVLEPTTRHLSLLRGLLDDVGGAGDLVNDAHLAALALEHGAVVVTYDNDFGRFRGVTWRTPGGR